MNLQRVFGVRNGVPSGISIKTNGFQYFQWIRGDPIFCTFLPPVTLKKQDAPPFRIVSRVSYRVRSAKLLQLRVLGQVQLVKDARVSLRAQLSGPE